jgi:hypothetical protein
VQEALAVAFAKHGITVDAATKPIADGLHAGKVAVIDGEVVETDVPDHKTRLVAAKTAFDLMGVGRGEGGGVTFNFVNVVNQQAKQYDL